MILNTKKSYVLEEKSIWNFVKFIEKYTKILWTFMLQIKFTNSHTEILAKKTAPKIQTKKNFVHIMITNNFSVGE